VQFLINRQKQQTLINCSVTFVKALWWDSADQNASKQPQIRGNKWSQSSVSEVMAFLGHATDHKINHQNTALKRDISLLCWQWSGWHVGKDIRLVRGVKQQKAHYCSSRRCLFLPPCCYRKCCVVYHTLTDSSNDGMCVTREKPAVYQKTNTTHRSVPQ